MGKKTKNFTKPEIKLYEILAELKFKEKELWKNFTDYFINSFGKIEKEDKKKFKKFVRNFMGVSHFIRAIKVPKKFLILNKLEKK